MRKSQHKPGRGKAEYVNAFPGLRKFLNQCVVCQQTGYDPERIDRKEGKYFLARIREYFHPLKVNEIGVCRDCEKRLNENDTPG